jgi:hypothetical protein
MARMNRCHRMLLGAVLVGCVNSCARLPHRIEIEYTRSDSTEKLRADVFEFKGEDRRLTIYWSDGEVEGPSNDYLLSLEAEGQLMRQLGIDISEHGRITSANITTNKPRNGISKYLPPPKGLPALWISNPRVRIDGKEVDMVEAWKRLARYDKRFAFTEVGK